MKKTFITLSLFLVSAHAFCQINLGQGLMACYPFTGNANDSSGNGHNATVYGATLTTGRAGVPNTAYYFDGTSNYMIVPQSNSLDSPLILTMCAVVNPFSFYAGNCQANVIFFKTNRDWVDGHYGLGFDDSGFDPNCNTIDSAHECFFARVGTNQPADPNYSPYITVNTWYCVVATYDGDSTRIYVDGQKKFTQSTPAPIGANDTSGITIGHNLHTPFPYWFHGIIDDIRIYDRVLNNQEISFYCSYVEGIEQVEAANSSFSIYPNPSSGSIVISLNENRKTVNAILTITDALGKIVREEKITNPKTEITNLSPGFYFVQLYRVDGTSLCRKLIVE